MHVFWDNSNTVSGRWGLLGELDVAPLCHRLLGGPVSESGRLRHVLTGAAGPHHGRGARRPRRRRAFMLTILR
jgi:hypothetical protein